MIHTLNAEKYGKVSNYDTNPHSMKFHKLLIYIKGFLLITAFTNLFMLFDRNLSVMRVFDQIFYLVMVITLSISLLSHKRKIGVYLFYSYAMIELSLSYVTWGYAYVQNTLNQEITTLVLSYTLGTLAYLVPIVIYYNKRLKYLK